MNPTLLPPKKAKGFSLMETVIAIGIVAILLSSFIAVFGPAAQNIRRAISAEEAERLSSALLNEMNTLRQSEIGPHGYVTAFDKAFDWIARPDDGSGVILLCKYRGSSSSWGTPQSGYAAAASASGMSEPEKQNVILQNYVETLEDADADADGLSALSNIEGPAFVVRLTQLVYNNSGALVESSDTDKIFNPHDDTDQSANTAQYPEAAIAFSAKFYMLSSNSSSYIKTLSGKSITDLDKAIGKPLFTRNMAVRR